MTIDTRLRAAVADLEQATQTTVVPTVAPAKRSARPVPAILVTALVLLAAFLLVPRTTAPIETDTAIQPPEPTPTTAAPPTTASTSEDHAQFYPLAPVRISGDIEVADPVAVRARVLAGLHFDPNTLGVEWPLQPISNVNFVIDWMRPIAPLDDITDRQWVFVGEHPETGLTVVALDDSVQISVCAEIREGASTCRSQSSWMMDDSGTGVIPVVWNVPQGTVVVGLEETGHFLWQTVTADVVAFLRTDTTTAATLTAYDRTGQVLEVYVTDEYVEPAGPGGDLLPGIAVDLMRVLLRNGISVVEISEAAEGTEVKKSGDTDILFVTLEHADGTISYASLATEGEYGEAVWSRDPVLSVPPFSNGEAVTYGLDDDRVTYTVSDDLIIVRRIPSLPEPGEAIVLPIP